MELKRPSFVFMGVTDQEMSGWFREVVLSLIPPIEDGG